MTRHYLHCIGTFISSIERHRRLLLEWSIEDYSLDKINIALPVHSNLDKKVPNAPLFWRQICQFYTLFCKKIVFNSNFPLSIKNVERAEYSRRSQEVVLNWNQKINKEHLSQIIKIHRGKSKISTVVTPKPTRSW